MHHEMAMAQDILRAVLKKASEKGLSGVIKIKVRAGETRLVNPDYLKRGFEMASSGTIAQGAELDIKITPLRAKCRSCGGLLEGDSLSCPSCKASDIEIASGQELLVEEVE